MAKIIYGDRVGKEGRLMVGCCAIIFDENRERVLLTRRTDNNRWCIPGGAADPGESVAEACAREVWEETCVKVQVGKLIGVYSDPNRLIRYADGNQFQLISFSFEADIVDGELGLSNEVTEIGYFSREEIKQIDLMEHHTERIEHAFANQEATFVR